MRTKRLSSIIVSASIGLALCAEASALGFGRAPQVAVLGQPLDFSVAVSLEPGETIGPDCVGAEVVVGDSRVPPPLVRTDVEFSAADRVSIRVRTGVALDEPVVSVQLMVGCPQRLSRRFTLFADPPLSLLAPAQAGAPVAAEAFVAATESAAPAAIPDPAPTNAAAPGVGRTPPAGATPAGGATTARAPVRRVEAAPAATPPRRNEPRSERVPAAVPAARPRLRLDPVMPAPVPVPVATRTEQMLDEAISAVAQAASAAREAASAASAAEERIEALERTVTQLRAENQSGRSEVAQLRAAAERGPGRWVKPLALATLVLALLAAWLAWRLRALERERQREWLDVAKAGGKERPQSETSPIPLVTSELLAAPTQAGAQPPAALAPYPPLAATDAPAVDLPIEDRYAKTEVLPPSVRVDLALAGDGAPRDVSIEELIDLEQQAEFFIVLGQDDAAVDLLVEHLRSTGGGSPLPYLKLLEIHRRLGDRAAYERIRDRFNQRFNAYAPDWESDLQHGRTLEDYPGIVPRLQEVWPRPMDAMAELEALLFRKSRGELFELPAYREVLLLYSLARDLLERETGDGGSVDVLLPLGAGAATASAPASPSDSDFAGFDGSPPTAPLALDLTLPDGPAPSIFGTPDDAPEAGRNR
jgi:hypothetical protein